MKALIEFLKLKWLQVLAWYKANFAWPKWYLFFSVAVPPLMAVTILPLWFGWAWFMLGFIVFGYVQTTK